MEYQFPLECSSRINNIHRNSIRKVITAFLIVTFCFSTINVWAKASFITQLDTVFFPLKKLLKSDPYAALEKLKQLPAEQSNDHVILAQSYLLKSHSYADLEYPDLALENAEKGLAITQEIQQPWLFHHLQLARSYALDRKGTPQQGLTAAKNALAWASEENDTTLTVIALDVKATLLVSLVDYVQANKDLERAFSLAAKSKPSSAFNFEMTQGDLLLSFAMIYEYRDENKNSLEYFEKAVDYYRKKEEWSNLSNALYGLGLAQRSIGNIELARSLLLESLNIANDIHAFQGAAYSQKELAIIEEKFGHINLAIKMNLDALNTFKQANNTYMFIAVSHSLFRLYLKEGDLQQAEYYIKFANQYINDDMPYQDLAIKLDQTQLFAAKGDYKKAYQLAAQMMKTRYQLNKDQSSNELNSMRTRYDLQNKAQQNKLLQQDIIFNQKALASAEKNNQLLFIILILSSLVAILILYFYLKLKRHKIALEELANTDGLTGLFNRRKGLELASIQLDLANRHKQHFCLVLIDLDWFKKINDTFGHGVGDQVLIKFSALCVKMLRHTDIIIRYGGEEFLIALPFTTLNDAKDLINKLKKETSNIGENIGITFNDKTPLKVTFSAGIAHQYQRAKIDGLINQTDLALYQAKNDGRNRIVVYQETAN